MPTMAVKKHCFWYRLAIMRRLVDCGISCLHLGILSAASITGPKTIGYSRWHWFFWLHADFKSLTL